MFKSLVLIVLYLMKLIVFYILVIPVTTRRLSSETYMEDKLKRLSLTTFNESGTFNKFIAP